MTKVTQQDFDNAFTSIQGKLTNPSFKEGGRIACKNLKEVTDNIVHGYAGFFIPEPDDIDDYDESFYDENCNDRSNYPVRKAFLEVMKPFNEFLLKNSGKEFPTFSKEDKKLFEKNKNHLFEMVS